jgi:AraC-like DNA-binding protein
MRCDREAPSGQHLPQCASAPGARAPQELGGVVQQIVTRLLPNGSPDVQSVAEMVRVSARTLQRRLSEEGLTFAGLVARTRFDVAQRMLDDPARRVIDVALDLGYSDQAHFTRAFVRWTGLAQREFQRLRAAGSSSAPGPRNPSCVVGAAPRASTRSIGARRARWSERSTPDRPRRGSFQSNFRSFSAHCQDCRAHRALGGTAMETGDRRDGPPLPMSRSFVVQFAADTLPASNRYHGRVEHIDSGRSRRFASLDELIAFVNEVLDAEDADR